MLHNSDTPGRGGAFFLPPPLQISPPKMRFFKSYHTLITFQPRKKTQLNTFVSTLKRFVRPLQTAQARRTFWFKIECSSVYLTTEGGRCNSYATVEYAEKHSLLNQKVRLACAVCRGRTNLFSVAEKMEKRFFFFSVSWLSQPIIMM